MIPKITTALVAYSVLVGWHLIAPRNAQFIDAGEGPEARSTAKSISPARLRQSSYIKEQAVLGQLNSLFSISTTQDACSDPIDNCKDPVKYLGANGECACFACEYGKPTQNNICTKNQADKDKLLKRNQRP